MARWIAVSTALTATLALTACSGGTTAPDASPDTAAMPDVAQQTDARDAATTPAINGCFDGTYIEMTGATESRTVSLTAEGQLDWPCMIVSTGQTVTFAWPFATISLVP